MRVYRAVICVTGLLKPHLINAGLVGLSKTLRHHVPRNCVVKLYRWKDYCEIIKDLEEWNPSRALFVGHSYGVSTSLFVCKHLLEVGSPIIIDHLISTDGVWRERVDQIDVDSLKDNHRLEVPTNVRRLHTFRQKHGPIQGHSFAISYPTEWVTDRIVDHPKHARMDRLPEFIELTKGLAVA